MFAGDDDFETNSDLVRAQMQDEVNKRDAEIARLRAEVEKLRVDLAAKTLREETVNAIRGALKGDIASAWTYEGEEAPIAALADLNRAYPEEE